MQNDLNLVFSETVFSMNHRVWYSKQACVLQRYLMKLARGLWLEEGEEYTALSVVSIQTGILVLINIQWNIEKST